MTDRILTPPPNQNAQPVQVVNTNPPSPSSRPSSASVLGHHNHHQQQSASLFSSASAGPGYSVSAKAASVASSLLQARSARNNMNKQRSHPTPPELDVDLTELSDALVGDMPIIPLPHKEKDLPTPAPSPRPVEFQGVLPTWSAVNENEDSYLRQARQHFVKLTSAERQRFLAELLNICDTEQLSFVSAFVAPRLKKDFLKNLPIELGLRILSHVEDPKTLARASQVSKHWYALVNDDLTWKNLCNKHRYRRLSTLFPMPTSPIAPQSILSHASYFSAPPGIAPVPAGHSPFKAKPTSYKSHFRQRYMVDQAWKVGGRTVARHITNDQGVVTSLHLTAKYIIVALDNAKIHLFSADGCFIRTLSGHENGVWAMVHCDETLVSGGCDRDMRVWDLPSGHESLLDSLLILCLKMSNTTTVVSGSRDTTLRVWDIERGICTHVLVGHQASVRCLDIFGDLCVSGSYDTTAKIWSVSTGTCLRTLQGHYSQIYAVAFDGAHIATGSLDTTVRIWEASTGNCLSVLQGHTSLVGQLQLRYPTMVTGGSDGSVRVWNLEKMSCVHRLAAHDNSVTSLQFDDKRIVSGGSDGRVKA
ncbi:F-box/WD repeat-containing protein 7 [Neolecta irregularis DAH-3]|uniref:F-box/WD repeat-containing protein 7 n=1 Tax=Neolecta irregularis (strain DAH-3) TaxID=1198029 RepID=A0A1U7LMU7_NEOID|nr:F-box/WD repeat-containing protein 7 [Neolecta irregularis DAH-3]|eukprot:OLL23967.1 F-box/WD repeat-containing protein 7 [Neolecta irregularis DAH-3]